MIPAPGVTDPSQVRETLYSMSKKSFAFFYLNQTPFPRLEESCFMCLEETLCLSFKEGQKQKQNNKKPRAGYKDPQIRPPSQASLRHPLGCPV